jgi:hypothetical protein
MTLPTNRYPYFLRVLGATSAVVLACVCVPFAAFAVPEEHDPIGEGVEDIPHLPPRVTEQTGPLPVVEGEVLIARPGTRETDARISLAFEDGYVRVTLTSVIENRATFATPVTIVARVPESTLISASCGRPCTATTSAEASSIRIETAPDLEARASRTITLEYAVPTIRLGSNVRAVLPPRGADTRVGRVRVLAPGMPDVAVSGVRVGEAGVEISAFAAMRITARKEVNALVATTTRTENGVRLTIVAPTRTLAPLRIAVLVDGSPSTLGPARNAIARAVATLLARLPRESEIVVVRFGSNAEQILERTPVASVVATDVVSRLADAGGTTTRLDRAIALVSEGEFDRVLVLGDGGLTRVREDATATLARRREITYVLFGAHAPSDALLEHVARGRIDLVDARSEGEIADTTHDDGPLGDLILASLMGTMPVVLRDGRAILTSTRIAFGQSIDVIGPMVRPTLTVSGRRVRLVPREDAVLARLPEPRRPRPTYVAPNGRDLPRETILEALRRQFIPPARLCLREERRGRARHAVRAELVVHLAHREVTAIDVNGDLDGRLRTCLGDALERLILPAAAAPMIVRYPIHTIEADVPPVIELDEETRTALERTMGEERIER